VVGRFSCPNKPQRQGKKEVSQKKFNQLSDYECAQSLISIAKGKGEGEILETIGV
jgi:hypothetical protein